MNKDTQFLHLSSGRRALLALVAVVSLAFPSIGLALNVCIRATVEGDQGQCEISNVISWRYYNDADGSVMQFPNNYPSECAADDIVIGTEHFNPVRQGYLHYKNLCGSTGRYQLIDVQSPVLQSWLRFPDQETLLFREPGHIYNPVPNYWMSGWINVVGTPQGYPSAVAPVTLTYVETASYTTYYSFTDDSGVPGTPFAYGPVTWGPYPVNTEITAFAFPWPYYLCIGWRDGRGTFAAEGETCSIGPLNLLSDINGANQLTWIFKKASVLTTTVSSPGPGIAALNGPFTFDPTLTKNGQTTVRAIASIPVDDINRWNLIGSVASGSLSNENSGLSERSFNLKEDTTIEWQYRKEAKIIVSFDASVPQGVRNAANAFPAPGETWHPIDGTVNPNIATSVTDPDTGDLWVCTGWTGSGDTQADGTDLGCEAIPDILLTQQSTITWKFARQQRILVELEGFDRVPSEGDHLPAAGNHFYPLDSQHTISAKNEIYIETIIDGEPLKLTRYVLQGWTGGGDIPATGSATNGAERTQITPFTLTEDSFVRWIYLKEVGVRVDISTPTDRALADPVECATGNYVNCVEDADDIPRPAGVAASLSSHPVNFYPAGIQLTLTTKHQVSDGGGTDTASGLITKVGSLVGTSGPQIYGTRMAETFTLNAPLWVEWDYSNTTRYSVGEGITRPGSATSGKPIIDIVLPTGVSPEEAFFWSSVGGDEKLYPLRELSFVRLTWPGVAQPEEIRVVWPSDQTQHIAKVPAHIAPASTSLKLFKVAFTQNNAQVSNGTFNANTTGKSVLLFLDGGVDPLTTKPKIIVVNTISWDSAPELVNNKACTIGEAIKEPIHIDPENLNGYVFNELAFYDGSGPDKAYDRSSRSGPIIPVNTVELSNAAQRMLVVWFKTDSNDIGWPTYPIDYECSWPSAPQEIVIASGDGWPAPSPGWFPEGRIYYQDDPLLPGYNPNEEHGLFLANTVYALRNDFNVFSGASEPYVLLKFRNASGDWEMQVFSVLKTSGSTTFTADPVEAGQLIQPFPPLNRLPPTTLSVLKDGATWYHRDHKNGHWAKAADSGGNSEIVMDWYYPLQGGFYYPDFNGDGLPDLGIGEAIPFLGYGGSNPVGPQEVRYPVVWPSNPTVLRLGETLTTQPLDVLNMASVRVLFDESLYAGEGHLAKLFDPISEHRLPLAYLPEGLDTQSQDGKVFFNDAPYYLGSRFFYDPVAKELVFKGVLDDSGGGAPPFLLPNIMNKAERGVLIAAFPGLSAQIEALFDLSRNPNGVDFGATDPLVNPFNDSLNHSVADWNDNIWGLPLGIEEDTDGNPQSVTLLGVKNALTAGTAAGTGYVTLIENDHESLGAAPVAMHVIEISQDVYPGEIRVIESSNVFDEKLTLRHNADFGGEPERFVMEWYYRPDDSGVSPPLPIGNDPAADGWLFLGKGVGMSEFTIEGADVRTLSDNWVVMRYYYRDVFPEPPANKSTDESDPENWSSWAGAPGNQQAMLAEGWLKRVVDKLNPLDARVRDFQRNETNTLVSMISQAGAYCGNTIALNDSPENLNSVGLIAAYQTLLKRGMSLSIEAGQKYGPANVALLNMATRVSDLNMLLANEAYADSIDPTIGFTTSSGELGSFAPATFAFQNQLSSSLEEELILLRGRDDTASTTQGCPIYNRLYWNFTNGDGEVAYVQTYNILDQDVSGVIDESDASDMFPQGHGDAWGHYLSAMKPWYRLLANENFTWEPRAESVLVAGVPVLVDYLDERKFAVAAAAKARAGNEIVDLTYRSSFVDDPDGQWQGYKDSDEERAWGVDEWSRRVGTGALLDWALANAMLPPEDLNPAHTGIQKIDRISVSEIKSIAGHFHTAQEQIDKANAGLNPIGLARGAVPFDIDPSFLDVSSAEQGLTHFEQIYGRALKAMQNATRVFDFANEFTQSLRRSTDSLQDFKQNLLEQETDYKNRLIEIFGYPYSDDIGTGRTYPAGYSGPDWAHFMIVDRSELTGEAPAPIETFQVEFDFSNTELDPEFGVTSNLMTVDYPVSTDGPWIVKDANWNGSRRATGEVQDALSEYMQTESELKRALKELEISISGIKKGVQNLERKYQISSTNIQSIRSGNVAIGNLETEITLLNVASTQLNRALDLSDRIYGGIIEGLPKAAGVAPDVTFAARLSLGTVQTVVATGIGITADALDATTMSRQQALNAIQRDGDAELYVNGARYEVAQKVAELGPLLNAAIVKQFETYQLEEAMRQALGRYGAAVARGERLMSERAMQRKLAAADIQDYRYNDISFRIFRNDTLQKFRAQFDLAARYVYLAAMAYDYETNLLGSDTGSGSQFLSDIFRQRSLGVMSDGNPVAGLGGLADVLARLGQNFELYRTRLGFNNPQTETNRFSLRKEHFRIRDDETGDAVWKTELASHLVTDLWDEPDFKRYALPFTTESAGEQPALVIPFSTTVSFGKNFFGWPLSGGDSAYDPTNFATKIRSVGVWFEGYPLAQLSNTPRVYLVPVGADVLRAPGDDTLSTRQWNIVDQKLPAPFTLGASDLNNPNWIPINDSLSGDIGDIRRYPSLRAYEYSDVFDSAETTTNSRLIGRSVWNTQWLLIIPGGTLLFNPETGLETFLNNVTDIKLFFQTYSYTGE